MDEDEIFGLLDGGAITIEDRRTFSTQSAWAVYIADSTDIEIECYGPTKDAAWSKACTELLAILKDREELALGEHPSETFGERNPSLNH